MPFSKISLNGADKNSHRWQHFSVSSVTNVDKIISVNLIFYGETSQITWHPDSCPQNAMVSIIIPSIKMAAFIICIEIEILF